jgi:hypothetical protein
VLTRQNRPQPCRELLAAYQGTAAPRTAEKLRFADVGARDVYNITAPFRDAGAPTIAGRVEDRASERSTTRFFVERGGTWSPGADAPTLDLQDPFVTFIGGELVLGGVEVTFDATGGHVQSWRTRFYRGTALRDLRPFATGPEGMKDIRLLELPGGKILVLTRPLGLTDARAAIGYTCLDSLDDLDVKTITSATLFRDQFTPDEWGGANEAHLLANGLVGVLGHVAWMEAGEIRHYYAMTFALRPETGEKTPLTIVATRKDFPPGPAKRPDLQDVIFSGGLARQADGSAWLYAGVSDAEAHRIRIPDPFLAYERL